MVYMRINRKSDMGTNTGQVTSKTRKMVDQFCWMVIIHLKNKVTKFDKVQFCKYIQLGNVLIRCQTISVIIILMNLKDFQKFSGFSEMAYPILITLKFSTIKKFPHCFFANSQFHNSMSFKCVVIITCRIDRHMNTQKVLD